MNWHDAADAKLDLWNFWKSEEGLSFARGFSNTIMSDNPNAASVYQHVHEMELTTMYRAEPIYVAPEIMDIVEAAAPTFKPESFESTDLITPCGFVLLPRRKLIPDAQGKTVSFRAFAWYPAVTVEYEKTLTTRQETEEVRGHGVWMSFYSHVNDLDEESDGYGLMRAVKANQSCPWVFLHGMTLPFGMTPMEYVENAFRKDSYSDETMEDATNGWWSFVQTLLRLSMQHLSSRERHYLPRSSRRRLERAKMQDTRTTVITLRRPRSPRKEGEGEPVHWKNRWIVGAHWRNQWYPSLGRHRQIWINEHIKGPEDRPLSLRKGRAFNFVK